MNETEKRIGIVYLENSFNYSDINEMKERLSNNGYTLDSHEFKGFIQASISELAAQIEVFLSNDVVQDILIGLAVNAVYDFLKYIYKKIKDRPVSKIQAGSVRQEPCTVHVIIGKTRILLPTDIDEAKFEAFLNKLFDKIPELNPEKEDIAKFDDKSNKIVICSEERFILNEANRKRTYDYIKENSMCTLNQIAECINVPTNDVWKAVEGLIHTGHLKKVVLPLGNIYNPDNSVFYKVTKEYY